MNYIKITLLALSLGYRCYENEPLSARTSFKIGGPADLVIECDNLEKLPELLAVINKENIPLTVIGNGSNLLISDDGIRGVVLVISDDSITVDGDIITASAGAKLSKLCNAALKSGLSGFEFGYGIPGSVGGAVYMNAGAYDGEIKQVIVSATSITRDGEIKTRTAEELLLGYRTSVFKQNDEIILSAKFKLIPAEKDGVKAKMDDYLSRRKDKQPLEFPSAGSTFKRPEGYFAGALIEQCGLKGFSVGGAEVSTKHAGFVINRGNATCSDVKALIKHIQDTVFNSFGVVLETEVIYLG